MGTKAPGERQYCTNTISEMENTAMAESFQARSMGIEVRTRKQFYMVITEEIHSMITAPKIIMDKIKWGKSELKARAIGH